MFIRVLTTRSALSERLTSQIRCHLNLQHSPLESEWEKEGDTQFYQRKDLQVIELSIVDDSLVGSAANTTDFEMDSPFAVHVVCFVGDDIIESRRLLADQDGTIMPGETVTFSDERYTDTCTEHLVSVSGYVG